MQDADITIIGAGVIGLAIAAEIARPDLSIFILEKITRTVAESVHETAK